MQALNLLGEPPWRSAAPKGFPDEDAAWIAMDWHNASTLPINWRDASPAFRAGTF